MSIDQQNSKTGPESSQNKDNYVFHVYNQLLKQILGYINMERAVLLLKNSQGLTIEAEVFKEPNNRIIVNSAFQLKSITEPESYLPLGLINETYQTKNRLVLVQPDEDKSTLKDPYFRQKKSGCIICATITSESESPGVIYLEGNASQDNSNSDYKNLLHLFLEQASLSLESIRSYSLLQAQLADRLQEINTLKKNKVHEDMAKIRFLKGVNAEIQAPLNSIMGFSQLLARKGHQLQLPPEVKQYIDRIEKSGIELTEMLNNLLEYASPNFRDQSPVAEKVDVKLLLKSIILSHQLQSRDQGRDINFKLEGDLPKSFYSNRSILTRVLTILIDNAERRSHAGDNIFIKGSFEDSRLTLGIEDEGPALSPDLKERLLNNSVIIGRETGSPLDYIGMELSSAEKMIDQLNGKLEYQIMENNRSGFVLRIDEEQTRQQADTDFSALSIEDPESKMDNGDNPVKTNTATLINSEDLLAGETDRVAHELESLISIPIFKGRTLISRIRKIKQTCGQSNQGCLPALESLEKSVYDGNARKFNLIINNLLNQAIT